MARPSSIDRLPKTHRDLIQRMRFDGRFIEEILTALHEQGLAADQMPSRAAMGRHIQDLDAEFARVRQIDGLETLSTFINEARTSAASLQRLSEPLEQGTHARANIEMMQALFTRALLARAAEGDLQLDAKEVATLSRALRSLAGAESADANTRLKLRDAARDEARREIAGKVEEVAGDVEAGVPITPAEMLARIRALYAGEG